MTCPSADLFDQAYGLLGAPASERAREHAEGCADCGPGLGRLRDERQLLEAAVRDPAFERACSPRPRPARGGKWLHAGYAALLVMGLFGIVLRPAPETPPAVPGGAAPAQDTPEDLARQLGAEDVEARDRAADALVRMGADAEPVLRKALAGNDPEIRARAHDVLARIRKLHARERLLAFRGKLLGQRLGGKRAAVLGGGGEAKTEDAVLAALKWLSRHQSPDGSWEAVRHPTRCGLLPKYAGTDCPSKAGASDFDTGLTGLALLAFAGSGYTAFSKDTYDGICFGDVVRKGLQWIAGRQDREGCIGSRRDQKYVYNHAIATLALAEQVALAEPGAWDEPLKRAVKFLVAAQNPGKGWRYSPTCGDNDTSVTFWAATALRVAWHAKVEVPDEAFQGALAWFDSVTDPAFGRVGYTHRGTGKVFTPGLNDSFHHHEALTAGAGFVRMLLGKSPDDPVLRSGMDLLLRDPPRTGDPDGIDYYYWHLGTIALFQHDGPDGARWKAWNEALKDALVQTQNRAGCKSGSWEPTDRWGGEGGRLYATALNALTLETYYRYAPVPRE
jgi:hypothetical protein